MTCSDSDNLPPGMVPSDIPGNSRKEIAIERAMEEVDERIGAMAYDLEQVARQLRATEGQGPEYVKETLFRSGDALEEIQTTLDDAFDTLGRVLDD